jgi:stage V sporulation protein D (sporulation-specific penicillin-binding protein)
VRSGGKTGTAQKALGGHYLDGKYFASFIGFFPVEKPIAVALVVIDEPRVGLHHGGVAAAPVFGALARDIYIHAQAAAPAGPAAAPAAAPLVQTAALAPAALPGGGT